MKRILFVILTVMLLLSACVPAVTPTSDAAAESTVAPTVQATPSPSAESAASSAAVPAATSPGLTKQTASASAPQIPVMQAEEKPIVEGLILIMDARGLDLVETQTDANGGYREELMYDDMISVVIERLPSATEYDQASVSRRIQELEPNARDMELTKDDDASARFTYPAWKAAYLTGTNEDTRLNEDLFIQTDLWDFRLHVGTPGDWYEDYEDIIAHWFEIVTLTEM